VVFIGDAVGNSVLGCRGFARRKYFDVMAAILSFN
jgi:hypothetical protein